MAIRFSASRKDEALIVKIVDRAEGLLAEAAKSFGQTFDRMSALMDVTATHANGTPLDLKRLAEADDFNLLHDFCGIQRHIDRTTGKLTGHFVPRFARRAA